MLYRAWALVYLVLLTTSCAGVRTRPAAHDITIIGLSSQRNPELARRVAANRALARAEIVRQPKSLAFALTTGLSRPLLKLSTDDQIVGLNPTIETLEPFGAKATVVINRSAAQVVELQSLPTSHVTATATGIDLAIAHDRADRDCMKQAITAAAQSQHRHEHILSGHLTFVDYKTAISGQNIVVTTDIHVDFDSPAAATAPAPQQSSPHESKLNQNQLSEDQEEVEPPDEVEEAVPPASLPTSQPASTLSPHSP